MRGFLRKVAWNEMLGFNVRAVGVMTRGGSPERVALGEKSQRGGFDSRTLSPKILLDIV